MPTFRPDVLVFFRAKVEVSMRAFNFIATHKPSLGVTGSHTLLPEVAVWSPVDCALTALQCGHPTLGNFLPPFSVEAFSSRGALDVDGLFQQTFLRSHGPVNHRSVLPVAPSVLRHRRLLQRLGSACIPVFLQPGFQSSLGLADSGVLRTGTRYCAILYK